MSRRLEAHDFTLILAAGSGTRLQSLTTNSNGQPIPKQFCSLSGGPSMLRSTLARAFSVTPPSRTFIVVAQEHEAYWRPEVSDLPAANVIVQPCNRGTAIGILLPLLHILRRDPDARVLLLPSDHFIADEAALGEALHNALASLNNDLCLIGIEPEHADPELGYIVPLTDRHTVAQPIAKFVEKPSVDQARQLIRAGAMWNSFIIASKGAAIVDLINHRYDFVVRDLRAALARSDAGAALPALYRMLPTLDFSKDILQGMETGLQVVRAMPCGWTDLGTPERVASCLTTHRTPVPPAFNVPHVRAPINLAAAYKALVALAQRHGPSPHYDTESLPTAAA